MSANVTMNDRRAAEHEMLRRLDLKQLEALAAESQAMIDRALAALTQPGCGGDIELPAVLPVTPRGTARVTDQNAADEVVPGSSVRLIPK